MASFFGRLFDLFNDESDSNWEDVLLNGRAHCNLYLPEKQNR